MRNEYQIYLNPNLPIYEAFYLYLEELAEEEYQQNVETCLQMPETFKTNYIESL